MFKKAMQDRRLVELRAMVSIHRVVYDKTVNRIKMKALADLTMSQEEIVEKIIEYGYSAIDDYCAAKPLATLLYIETRCKDPFRGFQHNELHLVRRVLNKYFDTLFGAVADKYNRQNPDDLNRWMVFSSFWGEDNNRRFRSLKTAFEQVFWTLKGDPSLLNVYSSLYYDELDHGKLLGNIETFVRQKSMDKAANE